MTLDQIKEKITEIEHMNGDDERQHSTEDELYLDFIKYVSTNPIDNDLAAKAQLVQTTQNLTFCRWCA